MDDNLHFEITPNGEEKQFVLHKPCALACPTEVGPINLILDQDHPIFLFVEIDSEMRRCYDLRNYNLRFVHKNDVLDFLEKVRDSDFFTRMVEDEIELNEEWEEL